MIFKVAKQEEILRQEREKVDKEREEFHAQKQKFDEEMARMAEMHQIQVLRPYFVLCTNFSILKLFLFIRKFYSKIQ